MDYPPHVWFIDSHSKCDGGYDDVAFVRNEVVVCFLPFLWCHRSMIRNCLESLLFKKRSHTLSLFNRVAIDDSRS